MSASRVSIGCSLADPYLTETEVKSLEYVVSEAGVNIPLVIVNHTDDPDYDPESEAEAVNEGLSLSAVNLFFDVLKREKAWTFVIVEKKLAELLGSDAAFSKQIPVEEVSCLSEAEFRYVSPIMDGNWAELPASVVELIGESSDIVIRYGFGLLKGEVLHEPEFGVLSFHPADIRQYRGLGPPQAFLDGRDVIGVTLQRLNEEIDGGEMVAYAETNVDDCDTLWEIYDELNDIQTKLLAQGILNLRESPSEITTPKSLGPYYSTKSRRKIAFAGRILYKNTVGRIQKKLVN
jgi:folate-dependent phosphoribosylglycinamide formyltransferase PurN